MTNLREQMKHVDQEFMDGVKESIDIIGNDMEYLHYYLMENINLSLKTLNSVLNEKDAHTKEVTNIIHSAALQANIYYYNLYFNIHEEKGTAKTGESYQWTEKREYKVKQDDHGVNYLTFDVIEHTVPKLNNEVNYNFVMDNSKNVIYTNKPFWDLSKVNNNLKEYII